MSVLKIYKNAFSKEKAAEAISVINQRDDWYNDIPVPERLRLHWDQWPYFDEVKNTALKDLATKYDITAFFVRYKTGTECFKHVDSSMFSAVGFLQKPEKGGELYIEDELIDLDVGDIVLFHGSDSHRANKVLEGNKFSLALFLNVKGFWEKEYQRQGRKPVQWDQGQ